MPPKTNEAHSFLLSNKVQRLIIGLHAIELDKPLKNIFEHYAEKDLQHLVCTDLLILYLYP